MKNATQFSMCVDNLPVVFLMVMRMRMRMRMRLFSIFIFNETKERKMNFHRMIFTARVLECLGLNGENNWKIE